MKIEERIKEQLALIETLAKQARFSDKQSLRELDAAAREITAAADRVKDLAYTMSLEAVAS